MASSEAPSPSSSPSETPTINNSTKTKSKYSIRYLVSNFKANFGVSKPKPLENIIHNDASTTGEDDDHGRALSLSSKLIRSDLLLVDSAFAESKEYMDHLNVKIKQAHEKFEELQTLGSSQRDYDELRKAVAKLKFQIPSHVKMRSADSNARRNQWPNINRAEEGMTHFFYKETQVAHSGYDGGHFKAFYDLPEPLRCCVLCFFEFPPVATIKRTTIIYLWIGQGFISWHLQGREEYPPKEREELPREEDAGNKIFDELIEKGFIEPIYQNSSLTPDSCRMSLFVRSSIYKEAEHSGFTSNGTLDLNHRFVCGDRPGHSCLINVGEAIINYKPQIFENMKHIQSLYPGRWQSSSTPHIELADLQQNSPWTEEAK